MSKSTKERLQQKLKQSQGTKLKSLYEEVMVSTDIGKIRELMANIISSIGQAKITSNDTSLKACFSQYLTMLRQKAVEWTEKDLSIIDSFVGASNNIASSKAEIVECFGSYESLPASSQNKKVQEAIKNVYKALYFDQTFTSSQANQVIQENFQSFRKAIPKKAFILAKALYEELEKNITLRNDLPFITINSCFDAKFNPQEFAEVLELFNINLQILHNKAPLNDSISRTITATTIIIPYILKIWNNDEGKARALLKYFIKQDLPFQANESYNHALIIAINCKEINLGFIKELLEANVVDVNTVITPETDNTCKVVKTPFSVAAGKVNFDLLALLLEHGADPYLANNILRSTNKVDYEEEVRFVSTSGLTRKIESEEKRIEYCLKVDEFIENFFLAKLAKAQDTTLQAARDQATIMIPSKESSSKTTILVDESSSSKDESKPSHKLPPAPSVLEQYLNYKQGAQNNAELPESKILEHKFDALFLKWMQSNESDYLISLTKLLEEHPELNTYAVTYLLNRNISTDSVSEAFADKPQLLHQFYTLKKKLNDHIKAGSENSILQKNVHEVQGNFANKIFVKIPEEILEELGTLDRGYKTKLLNQLSNLKFIKTDSHGISGIKSYSGCIKLKIAHLDKNLYTTQRYLDQDGNILIVFDRWGDHSDTPYKGKNMTTVYSDFKKSLYTTNVDIVGNHNDNTNSDANSVDFPLDEGVSDVVVLGDNY